MSVGGQVRAARIMQKMTKQELADAAGVTRLTIDRVERGGGNHTLKTLTGIAEALGMGIEDLLR